MKVRASTRIEKVQLVLPPPRRPDTCITKFAGWPQPLVRRARQIIFQLAEVAVSGDLFAAILEGLIRLRPPRRLDTYVAKFARWPQPLGILSVGTYVKQNNPGVVVGVQGESKESLEKTVEFLKQLTEFDNFDRFEWGSLIPFPGSKANRMLREHPDLKEKYKDFGNEKYLFQLVCMIQDWHRYLSLIHI